MNKPLIYFVVSIVFGCISCLILLNNIFIGAVVSASFLALLYFTIDKKFFVIIFLFFTLGMISYYNYFNVSLNDNTMYSVRMISNKGFYAICDYNGRKLDLTGNIKTISEGRNAEISGKFNPVKNYSQGIIGEINVDKFKFEKNDLISSIYDIKTILYGKLLNELGPSRTSFIMAVCYGETKYLDVDQKSDFQKLGVIHAVSVSGFHMALIYKIIENILGIYPAVFISFLYTIFTGLQASTLRALIMIFIVKFSKKLYKKYDAYSSLSLSAMVILMFKPWYVMDLGFILSYGSTLGIILYYKKITRILYILPKQLSESISITISAQIFSMPIVAMTIGNINFGFILGNILLLPFYSAAIIAGNLALIFMNFDFAFKLICKALYIIMTAIDGAQYFLLSISPEIITTTYIDSLFLIILYMSYILFKNGFTKFKYIPCIFFIIVLIQSYRFFPVISYLKYEDTSCAFVFYKSKSILLLDGYGDNKKQVFEILKKNISNKVITNPYDGYHIELCGRSIEIQKTSKNKGINLFMNGPNGKIAFTQNKSEFTKKIINSGFCDIINVPLIKNNKEIITYIIVFNKAIKLNEYD